MPPFARSVCTALAALASLLLLLPACVSTDSAGVTQPSGTQAPASVSNAGSLDRDLFNRVNDYRRSRGLNALTWNSEMSRVANAHTQSMASKNELSHDGYKSRANALYRTGLIGVTENVAYNKGGSDPVGTAIRGWENSPSHKRSMSDRSDTQTGVGAAKNSQGYTFFTQLYGQ